MFHGENGCHVHNQALGSRVMGLKSQTHISYIHICTYMMDIGGTYDWKYIYTYIAYVWRRILFFASSRWQNIAPTYLGYYVCNFLYVSEQRSHAFYTHERERNGYGSALTTYLVVPRWAETSRVVKRKRQGATVVVR